MRPQRQFTDDELENVERLAAVLSQQQLADYLGIAARTFRYHMERNEGLAAAYKKGRANAIALVGGGLLSKARQGDNTAMIFYLKTQAGWSEKTIIDLNAELPELIFKLQSDEDDA